MTPRTARRWIEAALCLAAALLAVGSRFLAAEEDAANTLLFGAWCAALLLLLSLGLRLPMRIRGPAWFRAPTELGIALAAVGLTLFANLALYRHDVHFDATRTGRYTAPPELVQVVAALNGGVSVSYFYNDSDPNARAAKEALGVLARRQSRLRLRAVDLDREPDVARAAGVRAYNTFVITAAGGRRRVQVENTVDLRQLAYGLLRVQKAQEQLVCFITGHGEPYAPHPPHVHFAHSEALQGHEVPGAGDFVVGARDGLDRFRIALGQFGFADRGIMLATLDTVPEECAVVAAIGPRHPFAPGEAARLEAYLARGGRLLVMLDPGRPVEAGLREVLSRVGLRVADGVVMDPVNHYGTEANKVAVPWYPPHPITDRIAMTVFADARPLHLSAPPEGIQAVPLVVSSRDSYQQADADAEAEASGGGAGAERGGATLAVALQGRWPGAEQETLFRLVVAGNSAFATNAWFPVVSDGELAISMVRWLAGDTETPRIRPEAYNLPEITLTGRQMQAIFLAVEVLLPLSIVLTGALVWWRRR